MGTCPPSLPFLPCAASTDLQVTFFWSDRFFWSGEPKLRGKDPVSVQLFKIFFAQPFFILAKNQKIPDGIFFPDRREL
jgi:hypothetical protein